jgi:hypothetical protein
MADSNDGNDLQRVIDGIHDAIIANANPVGILHVLEFLAVVRTRLISETVDERCHATMGIWLEVRELLRRFVTELDVVTHPSYLLALSS